MDEVAYLDHLTARCGRPPARSLHPLPTSGSRPKGPRPTGELLAWRTAIEPVRATDLEGRDMTEILRHWDRRTVDTFRKRDGWIGYAEEHGIILDFGDRLSRFGPSDRLVLCLAGWVEYPYSQTNYAAATAGVALKPPAIERRRDDGSWETIEPHAGYPAGMPRLMTLDLTGKLTGPHCIIRIKTNMECYYDQAFVVVPRPRRRGVASRDERCRWPGHGSAIGATPGRSRRTAGSHLIYDYDYVDPAPLASFQGKLTRHGDVTRLLAGRRRSALPGRAGDEVQIEFRGVGPAGLAAGLDAQLCRPWDRLLQGRRPVHGDQRLHRAAPLARNAGVPVRARESNGRRSGLRCLPASVSDAAGRSGGLSDGPEVGGTAVLTRTQGWSGPASWRHCPPMSGSWPRVGRAPSRVASCRDAG